MNISWIRLLPLALAASALAALPHPAAAQATSPDGATTIFAEATHYTVRIRSSIRVGLGLDEAGSWSGAGFLVDRKRGWIVTNAHVSGRSPGVLTVAFKNHEF